VVGENARVAAAVEALRAGNLVMVGRLMNESHESSRMLFENSCEELDFLCNAARNIPGCFGARLTGGGFGGAVLALLRGGTEKEFVKSIGDRALAAWGRIPQTLVTGAGGPLLTR
jgi:galactokinase